jgi:autophagy-related protein 9
MASNLLSRLLPSVDGSPSIYETIRQHDEDSDTPDVEERAGLALDERNLGEQFHDLDLDNVRLEESRRTTHINEPPPRGRGVGKMKSKASKRMSRPRWMDRSTQIREVDEGDDDVPASLLIEGADEEHTHGLTRLPPPPSFQPRSIPISGTASRKTRQQWAKTQAEQGLHADPRHSPSVQPARPMRGLASLAMADPKEKAMWRWTNVQNLDNFLAQVYDYYMGHGFWAILLIRFFNLLTFAFVVGFTFFLTQCIDYGKLRGSNHMSEITIPRCTSKMGTFPNVLLWFTTLLWLSKLFQYVVRIRNLSHMHDFFHYLLDIPESEIQSTTWQDIVSRLMALRDANPNTATTTSNPASRRFLGTQNKQRMDAHDIANRLMRKENYIIAMFNKEILDMTLPIPFLGRRQFFSRTLEWNIYQCIIDFVFNSRGQIRPFFLKDTHRRELSDSLRRRFIFAGFTNLVIAPIIIVYNLVEFFFQNFNEYQKNPAQIGSRRYNPLAEWKFREFNELWHIFEMRMNMSYPFAARYVDQFPRAKTVQTARFVTFVTGALISVLVIASAIDPEFLLGFEITRDRNVLFYLGIFGSVWAVARGLLPDENAVYDIAYTLSEVIEFTHHCPPHWQDRLNSDEVRREFAQLYQLKIVIFLQEVFSMFFTPFILWYSLPKCSDRIIDFFREFTVHVDGIGYVCSFAEFNFQRNGNVPPSQPLTLGQANGVVVASGGQGLRDEFYATNNQKLEASYWGFMNDYARNPKTDVKFPYTRHKYHPPPPQPGLPSPTFENHGDALQQQHGFATARHGSTTMNTITSPQRATGFHSGTPRFAAQVSNSPLQSMLLDPHHQPSASGFGSPTALRPRTRHHHGASTKGIEEAPMENERQLGAGEGDIGQMATQLEDSGGELGSWKMHHDDDDSESEEDVDAVGGGAAGGVLGLLRQYQMAHGEGRTGLAGPSGGGGMI